MNKNEHTNTQPIISKFYKLTPKPINYAKPIPKICPENCEKEANLNKQTTF